MLSEAHASHSAHAAHATHATSTGTTSRLLFRELNNHSISCQHQRGNTRSIDKGCADNLSGIKDTLLYHVNIDSLGSIETIGKAALFEELVNNNGALKPCILANCLGRNPTGVLDDLDTNILIEVVSF